MDPVHVYAHDQASAPPPVSDHSVFMKPHFLRGPDSESVSDLGNGGWPNSMKLGEHIVLDELLLNPVLFFFVLSSFQFFQGGSHFGVSEYKNNTLVRVNFGVPLQ